MSDVRQRIARLTCEFLSIDAGVISDAVNSNSAIASFISGSSSLALAISEHDGNIHIVELNPSKTLPNLSGVLFIRSCRDPLTLQNFVNSVTVINASSSAASQLRSLLHSFFVPCLSGAESDVQLRNKLADAQSCLETVVRRDAQSSGDAVSNGFVVTPMDELLYWRSVERTGNASSPQKNLAEFVSLALSRFVPQLDLLSRGSMDSCLESMKTCEDGLNFLWCPEDPGYSKFQNDKDGYPSSRMRNLLDMCTDSFVKFLRSRVLGDKIWTLAYNKAAKKLHDCISVLREWLQLVKHLIRVEWGQGSSRRFLEGNVVENRILRIDRRLNDAFVLRSLHEELLSSIAQNSVVPSIEITFSSMMKVDLLGSSPADDVEWQDARALFERNLAPLESLVAARIHEKIGGQLIPALTEAVGSKDGKAQPQQLLQDLSKYKRLLERPCVRSELAFELKRLFSLLGTHTAALRDEFDNGVKKVAKSSLTNVDELVWMAGLAVRARSVASALETLVSGITAQGESDSRSLSKEESTMLDSQEQCKVLVSDIEKRAQDLCSSWSSSLLSSLESTDELSLKTSGKVMELRSSDGKLIVYFSEKLLQLLKDVRQIASIGFTVPEKLQQHVLKASKFYRHGLVLRQVALFYNSISSQIIPSQKPILLQDFVNFESVIKEQRISKTGPHVTWDSPEQLERYIEVLQSTTDELLKKNRRLRDVHDVMSQRAIRLVDTSLARQRQLWKDILQDMRKSFESVEIEFKAKAKSWRTHWDFQLYKCLDVQYKLCMETAHDELPPISVDLIFDRKGRRLAFDPPIEELRQIVYRELNKLLNSPAVFKSQSFSDSDIFQAMIGRNAARLSVAYARVETMILNVIQAVEQFQEWSLLLSVDLDDFVFNNIRTPSEFDSNIRLLKMKRKDLEKLPKSIRVNSLTVTTDRAISVAGDLLKEYEKAMKLGLSKRSTFELEEMTQFLDSALQLLSSSPQSIEEIQEASRVAANVTKQLETFSALKRSIEERNRIMKSIHGSCIDLLSMQALWDDVELRLSAHEKTMADQKDRLRDNLSKRESELTDSLHRFTARWMELKPKDIGGSSASLQQSIEFVAEKAAEFSELKGMIGKFNQDCEHFGKQAPKFDGMDEVDEDIQRTSAAWGMLTSFRTEIDAFGTQDWITVRERLHGFEDILSSWGEKLRGRLSDPAARWVIQEVDKFKKSLPSLKYCKGESFTTDHWSQLFKIAGVPKGEKLSTITLNTLLSCATNLVDKMDELKDLAGRAQGELTVREALVELQTWGLETQFSLTTYSDNGCVTSIIKDWREIMTAVGDHQSVISSMRDSPYFGPFADEASIWESRLSDVSQILGNLQQVQRRWLYLSPIFSRGALPQEQPRFRRIDEDFRQVMSEVESDSLVMSMANRSGLADRLVVTIDQLERCQKALSDFLEEKRTKFPRFYFLGDDDLLEILGQAQNPAVIQTHLKKLFQGINSVVFDDKNTSIIAIHSLEGEAAPLTSSVSVTGPVELWLSNLSSVMVDTLSSQLRDCVKSDDLNKNVSQILGVAENIHFTIKVRKAIQAGSLSQVSDSLNARIDELTSCDAGDDLVLSLKMKALVLDLIHLIDVVEQLKAEKVSAESDWVWWRQLKYTWNSSTCCIEMCDAVFDYTYEYQGNAPKLVHTPLTDKCYLTLTQGMLLGYGGNPYGPAGTGKTESVKALGQAFARQVLVFNCDEGIDYKSMGRIFSGLVKCGAWGCFDEFNRLEEDVLSAVSQQIQIIQSALKAKQPQVHLLGRTIDVNKNSGIFVTLNPAGKGYGGRSKLPDNLKQLFRSVAMSRPDNALIAEVLLSSEGFKTSRVLGPKIVSMFSLSRQLLSNQQHYDWGLRALKTILTVCGQLISVYRKTVSKSVSPSKEAELVIQAVRVNTLAKLTFADTHRFNALVQDLFPGVACSDVSYDELGAAIDSAISDLKLHGIESQKRKIFQLYEALQQRMGVVIVGPSGCGKSTLLKVLKLALSRLGRSIVQHLMNPKAMPRQQLLGHMDLDTREWFDGILTAAARAVVKEPLDVHSWIICDGDIDPEWVESLNSVLDDNRLLTMPSGERIRFAPNVNFIFETNDLRFASPATVSRMGMIFLSDEDLDPLSIVKAWILRQPVELQSQLHSWLDELLPVALEKTFACSDFTVATTRGGLIWSVLSHCQGSLTKEQFLVGLARGATANLSSASRIKVFEELFQHAGVRLPDPKNSLNVQYDVGTNTIKRFDFAHSIDLTPESLISSSPCDRDSPVIPCLDVAMNSSMFLPWLERGDPFIVVGPEGCGKSMLLRNAMASLRSVDVATVHCSARTSAENIIQKIQQSCAAFSSSSGRVYRPKSAERLILYLKDLNLPKPDKYDTIQLIAFLQQLISYSGFYDGLEWVGLERIQVVASMNPATTIGRHQLTTRFTAICRIASIDYSPRDQLLSIVSSYVSAAFMKRVPGHPIFQEQNACSKIASALLDVFDKTKATFSVDEHRHYLFTPRDVSSWIIGTLRYDIQSLPFWSVIAQEGFRVFRDRLVSNDSKQRFDTILWGVLRSHFKAQAEPGLFYTTVGFPSENNSFAGAGKAFHAVTLEDFNRLISQGLVQFGRDVKPLNILVVDDVLERISKLDRTLSRPGGCALLVGPSGLGRRTCLSLAAYLLRYETYTPRLPRGFSVKQFMIDLKPIVINAGVAGVHTVILIEDWQIVSHAILEVVNSLLASGEVPGMFSSSELDSALVPLKDMYSSVGFKHRSLYSFFVERVQQFLHIVLVLDPSDDSFRMRLESNPALISRCDIIWNDQWSREAMREVPRSMLADSFSSQVSKETMDLVISSVVAVHSNSSAPTPKKFVSLLQSFSQLYLKKLDSLNKQRSFLGVGLGKLKEAESTVDQLSHKAESQRILLKQKQDEADLALTEIGESMNVAGQQKKETEILQASLATEEVEMASRKQEVEVELQDVQPLIDEAKTAVGGIKRDNINEIRALRMPPEVIRDVLEGVLRLMGQEDMSWNSMRTFLARPSIIQEILNFDARSIDRSTRDSVKSYVIEKQTSFKRENAARVSQACAPLAVWVTANIRYASVLEKVSPLEKELSRLNSKITSSRQRLEECSQQVQMLDSKCQTLKEKFQVLTTEAVTLKSSLEAEEEKLNAARNLLSKLVVERDRWAQQDKDLQSSAESLPMNSILAAAFATYLPGCAEDLRSQKIQEWSSILGAPKFSMIDFLSTESDRLSMKAKGLPSDSLSMENAVSILNSTCWSWIIDPSQQAVKWLTEHLQQDTAVEIASFADERVHTAIELAVRFGKTLIIREADAVHPIIVPILRKDLQRQGPRWTVWVGDKLVDYSESFRLYLVTRSSSLTLTPDVASLVIEVNFSVTRSGLEGQMLGMTIQSEKPELEAKKSELLAKEEALKIQLADVEKKLLEELAKSEGNILQNKQLLHSLNDTKSSAERISSALSESIQLQLQLDNEREVYRPLATLCSKIFFLMQELKEVNTMYLFGLSSFLTLFKSTLNETPSDSNLSSRISRLQIAFKKAVFDTVSRSMFKSDRLTFAMHLARGLYPDLVQLEEWQLLIGSASLVSSISVAPPSWLLRDRIPSFHRLSSQFSNLFDGISSGNSSNLWERWYNSKLCEKEPLPNAQYASNPFVRVLCVSALRPDRLLSAMDIWACESLGISSVNSSSLSLDVISKRESSPTCPIMFIVTPGSDPSGEIEEFASRSVGSSRFKQLAMGQGQSEIAMTMLKNCSQSGDWLLLKNVHLVTSWLPLLEKEMHKLSSNPSFRLWLTTEPHVKFPAILLHQSVKIAYEAPPGVKKNILRTFESWQPEYFEQNSSVMRTQMMFILAWFHAIVQERRTYIPQGWTKFYEFNAADLRTAVDMIDGQLASCGGKIPSWNAVHGLLELAVYGGRLETDYDTRVLRTYLTSLFQTKMLAIDGQAPKQKVFKDVILPISAKYSDFLSLVHSLPDVDVPAMFGLPQNVGRVVDEAAALSVTEQLKAMSVSTVALSSFDVELWTARLSPIMQAWKGIADSRQLAHIVQLGSAPVPNTSAPLDTFIMLEVQTLATLLSVVSSDMSALSRVLSGTLLLTSRLQTIGVSFLKGEIPSFWADVWEGPANPLKWLSGVASRCSSLSRLHEAVRPTSVYFGHTYLTFFVGYVS
jgi:dynein heavy chain 2, cytosolic